MDNTTKTRLFIGDLIKVRVEDILSPTPNGINRLFRTTGYPIVVNASTPVPPTFVNTDGTVDQVSASDYVILDAEAGVIKFNDAPTCDFIQVDYYQWSFFSDNIISQALAAQNNDPRYAAVDLINSILADPQGTFFKTYQTGDDTVQDALSIPRIQSLRDEMLRQIKLPENAGSGWVGYRGLDALYMKNNIVNYQCNQVLKPNLPFLEATDTYA